MNYIKELNRMFDYCMSKQLSKSEVTLLHVLYMINNKEDWAAWFEADNGLVQRLTGGLSRQAICDARLKLSQRGRIEFREGKKNTASPKYHIIPFCEVLDIKLDIPLDVPLDKEVDIPLDVPLDYLSKPNKTKPNKKDIDALFESVWLLYPNKKGKGQVSDTQKKKLCAVGYDQLSQCIERYRSNKPDWQAYQNGSTFFNSGYVDYLDENYSLADGSPKNGDRNEEGRVYLDGKWVAV